MNGSVLVPLTLSSSGFGKLPVVEAQAKAMDAEVLLLHVLRGGAVPEDGLVTAEEAQARTHLDTVAAAMRKRGVRATSLVRVGRVGETVRDTAAAHNVRLIVVGASARGWWLGRYGLQARDKEIAREAPCPVLVVGPEQGGHAQPAGRHLRRKAEKRGRDEAALRRFDADAASVGPIAPRVLGTRTVELSRIVGSVPALSVGLDFRPTRRRREDEERHQLLMKQMAERPEQVAPPEVYKLGYGYYVFAGHTLVAAARAVGHAWIDATVTEYVPVEDVEAQQVLAERTQFERETGTTAIGAARPGTYAALKALIEEFGGDADGRMAATRWKGAMFRPLQRRLRELGVNQHFPGERSADIVVRIAAHRREESRRRGRELYWDEAVSSFAAGLPG